MRDIDLEKYTNSRLSVPGAPEGRKKISDSTHIKFGSEIKVKTGKQKF
jgi:hypothetical protein